MRSSTSSSGTTTALPHKERCDGRTDAELVVVYAVSSAWEWELAAIQVNPDPIRHEIQQLLAQSWTAAVRAAGVLHQTDVAVGGARPTRCSLHPGTTRPR